MAFFVYDRIRTVKPEQRRYSRSQQTEIKTAENMMRRNGGSLICRALLPESGVYSIGGEDANMWSAAGRWLCVGS